MSSDKRPDRAPIYFDDNAAIPFIVATSASRQMQDIFHNLH